MRPAEWQPLRSLRLLYQRQGPRARLLLPRRPLAVAWQATALQSGDTVVEQSQTWYDADGNTIATADYQRLPTYAGTGALTASNSYVTAAVSFYDLAEEEKGSELFPLTKIFRCVRIPECHVPYALSPMV